VAVEVEVEEGTVEVGFVDEEEDDTPPARYCA
jgi:hypothetical protein